MPWIGYEETTNEYSVFPEAQEYLRSLEGPVAVMSVVGLYRTGKSYLLNRLVGVDKNSDGFAVSPTVRAQTKGLWLMCPPLEMEGFKLLVVDTEGLGSLSATADHDMRVFSLALLLSSTFLYNASGTINEGALNNLSLVAKVAEHIRVSSEDTETEAGALAERFPNFIWCCRDFALQLVGENDETITPNQYLNNALRPHGDMTASKNTVRNAINDLFPERKRDCVCMVRPVADEKELQRLDSLPDEALRPEFLTALSGLKTLIRKVSAPMKQNDLVITGPLLAQLSQVYTDTINSGAVPVIKDTWTMLSETECRRAADDARRAWKSVAPPAVADLQATRTFFAEALAGVLKDYDKRAVGSAAPNVREGLVFDLEEDAKRRLGAAEAKLRERVREELCTLEKRVQRESANISDILGMFEDNLEAAKGLESVWYPEAFPSLLRSVEKMTFRMDKKQHELQQQVNAADLVLATVRTEAAVSVKEARLETEGLQEALSNAKENVARAEDEVAAVSRRGKEAHDARNREKATLELALQTVQARADDLEAAAAAAADTVVPADEARRHSDKLKGLAREKAGILSDLEQARADNAALAAVDRESKEQLACLEAHVKDLLPLQNHLTAATGTIAELRSDLEVAAAEHQLLEENLESESAQVQKEAMDTVKAIREVLKKERELAAKAKAGHEETLRVLQEKGDVRAKTLQGGMDQAEELARQRRNTLEESKKTFAKEREGLRGEIERYATMFKESQSGADEARKGWMEQIQDSTRAANKREMELVASMQQNQRESGERLRESEMELATLRARLESSDRRKAFVEEELVGMRKKLGNKESVGVEMMRVQTELTHVRERKETMGEENRKLTLDVKDLQKRMKTLQRQCSMEKTKISMNYEKQISILESRLLR